MDQVERVARIIAETLDDRERWHLYAKQSLAVIAATQQWQPISGAPKDGTLIDLWFPYGGRAPSCRWHDDDLDGGDPSDPMFNYWEQMHADRETFFKIDYPPDNGPTHFMLIPAPPAAEEGNA